MKERFQKWFAAFCNLVKHEELIRLELEAFDLRVQAANNFTEAQAKRCDVLEKRLNAAEAAAAGTRAQVIELKQVLDVATDKLRSATTALANHDERVKQMEALILRKAGMAIRRN